ncbi:MAG: putative toxin-antitoxin system toxin component, PIN family [Anaerolineae bacterium]|nr:putative toxin-antitoxin system toxin component, PIN family [Anaerolineae bacterium]
MRVVVDTNVLISAILWLGLPHRIIELAEQRQIVLCMTPPMLDELRYVLARPKFSPYLKARRTNVEEIIAALVSLIELYPTPRNIKIKIELTDPDDEMFLACAIVAGANYIISGDNHLLRLKRYGSIEMLSVAQFLKTVGWRNETKR